MFRPFLNSLMLGSLLFPFIAIAGSTAQGGDPFLWPNCGTGMWRQHPVITRRNELPTEWFCSGQNLFQQSVNER